VSTENSGCSPKRQKKVRTRQINVADLLQGSTFPNPTAFCLAPPIREIHLLAVRRQKSFSLRD
jgi:hypothetical protein